MLLAVLFHEAEADSGDTAGMIPQRNGDRNSVSLKSPEVGYTGRYTRDGSSLIRISDGLRLVTGDRGPQDNPALSQYYLVDKRPGKGYVSSLYGKQFDDRINRYEIRDTDDPSVAEIVVLHPVRRGRNGRGKANG